MPFTFCPYWCLLDFLDSVNLLVSSLAVIILSKLSERRGEEEGEGAFCFLCLNKLLHSFIYLMCLCAFVCVTTQIHSHVLCHTCEGQRTNF